MSGDIQTTNAVGRRENYLRLAKQLSSAGPISFAHAAYVLSSLSNAQATGMEIEWLAAFLSEFGGNSRADDEVLIHSSIFAANREWDL